MVALAVVFVTSSCLNWWWKILRWNTCLIPQRLG